MIHMETRSNRVLRFAEMHVAARKTAGRSQEYMALELGVSKKTVQNWEKGISSPSYFQSLEWFSALNVNPFPHYLSFSFPDEFQHLNGKDGDDKIEEAFDTLVEQLPIRSKRALIYLFYGNHGSSPNAILQLMLAYLHTPLKSRIAQAVLTKNVYEMEKALNNIICPENILPDMESLDRAIYKARKAALDRETSYSIVDEEREEGME